MKGWHILLGVVLILLGGLPLLAEYGYLPVMLSFLPSMALFYQIVSIILGVILIYFGIKKDGA